MATTIALILMPRPICSGGKITRIKAVVTPMIAAAPIPCAIWAITNMGKEPESAQSNEVAVKSPVPNRKIRAVGNGHD